MVDLTTKGLPLSDFTTLLFSLAEYTEHNDTGE